MGVHVPPHHECTRSSALGGPILRRRWPYTEDGSVDNEGSKVAYLFTYLGIVARSVGAKQQHRVASHSIAYPHTDDRMAPLHPAGVSNAMEYSRRYRGKVVRCFCNFNRKKKSEARLPSGLAGRVRGIPKKALLQPHSSCSRVGRGYVTALTLG